MTGIARIGYALTAASCLNERGSIEASGDEVKE